MSRAGLGAGRRRSDAAAWMVVCAAMFSCGWGGNQFTPLLDMYRAINGYSATVVDALLGAYVLGLAPALLLGGPISDRHGRRPVLLAGLVVSGLGSTALAVGGLPLLALGRLLCGVAVGAGMAVGTSWVTELSTAAGSGAAAGARRASLSLTAGFGIGAGVAGVLAQWGPWPESLPYLAHLLVTVAVLASVVRWGRETRLERYSGPVRHRLRMPSARHRRFRRLVLPLAPWVFGAAGIAYAIVPQAMAQRMGHWSLIYATVLTVATLGAGVLVQPLARRLDHAVRPRAILIGMVVLTAGIAVATLAVGAGSPALGLLAALVLGAAYGVALVAGLLEIQRLSRPDERAALTGVYYALSYVGFLLPTAVAAAGRWLSTDVELGILGLVCLGCTGLIAAGRSIPHGRAEAPTEGSPVAPTAPESILVP